jgi:hypothetical protein
MERLEGDTEPNYLGESNMMKEELAFRVGRLHGAWLALGYWHMCWSARAATIFRHIDSLRSMGPRVWGWNDQPWRIGWEEAVSYSTH